MIGVLACDTIPFPEEAGVFLACCHLMVANAVQDEETRRDRDIDAALAEAGLDASVDFRAQVIHLGEQVPEEWRPAVLALMTVDSPFLAPAEMAGGAAHRRIDAILDVVEAPYCAHEMQTRFSRIIEQVSEAAKDPTKAAVAGVTRLAAELGGGFASGWYGVPGIGPIAGKAVDWLFAESGVLPESVLEASKMVLCYLELVRVQASETEAGKAVRQAVGGTAYVMAQTIAPDGGSNAQASLRSAQRAWHGAYALLGGDEGGG